MSVASRLAAWWRLSGGLPVQTRGTGDVPDGPVMVEILVDGAWTDITSRVMTRDGSQKVQISTGRSGETTELGPGSCQFQLNSRDGLFSPRNPASPYYGKIGRNTLMRVSVPKGNVKDYRFQGEITAWPAKWDSTGADIWVAAEASGIIRRLSQGNSPLRSTMYRGITAVGLANVPVAYWPCEDGSTSTSIASAVGGPAMRIMGTPTLASYSGFAASAPLPVMGDAAFIGTVPTYTDTNTQFQIRFLMAIPSTGATNNQTICRFTVSAGGLNYALVYGTGGSLKLLRKDKTGATTDTLGPFAFAVDGKLLRVSIEITTTPFAVSVVVATLEAGAPTGSLMSVVWLTAPGRVTTVALAPDGGLTDTAFGHLSVQSTITSIFDLGSQLAAYDGETAGARIQRLEGEEGIAFGQLGTLSNTVAMGPQGRVALLDLIRECAAADLGILYERWTAFGLGYRTRTNLYNQGAGLALTYTLNQLADVPEPVDDDQLVRNDITVTRTGGSSARSTLDAGAMSTQAPPLGVGTYDDAVPLNVQTDDVLPDQAAWRLHLGTVDEARFPQISINLAHPSFANSTTLKSDALGLHPGDRITIADVPAQMGPDTISLLVIGVTETIDNFQHTMTFNCTPESPWHVAVADDGIYGRLDTAGSTLAADVGPTDTAVSVATATGPVWTYDHSETPWDLRAGGEVVTVVGLGTVINANPLLLADASGWTASNGSISYVSDIVHSNYGAAASIQVVPNGSSASGGVSSDHSAAGTISVGASYTAVGWVYSPAGWSDLRTCVDWYDASDVFLSTSLGSATVVAAGTWTFLTQTFTAPASASRAVTRARWGGTPAASDVSYWWAIRLIADATVSTTSPQPMTVVRSINGVTKAHAAGEAISLAIPTVIAL